jgi:hypothetical protein
VRSSLSGWLIPASYTFVEFPGAPQRRELMCRTAVMSLFMREGELRPRFLRLSLSVLGVGVVERFYRLAPKTSAIRPSVCFSVSSRTPQTAS